MHEAGLNALAAPLRRIGVIGAGAAGLITGQVLTSYGFEVEIFEKNDHIGGVWKFKDDGVIYDSLRTNLPKEVMAFNMKEPIEVEGQPRSYLGHRDVQTYLERFAAKHDLERLVRFGKEAVVIEPVAGRWRVKSRDSSGQSLSEEFDGMVICNGHFTLPSLPDPPGMREHFKGRIAHSLQYNEVKATFGRPGQKVLVVGARSSATDTARELAALGATIFVSDRNFASNQENAFETASDRLALLPAIERFTPEGVIFSNKYVLRDSIDCVLFCTGFQYDLPFLPKDLVAVEEGKRVRPLHDQLFALHAPSLALLGLPFMIIPFLLFYYQALYVAQVFKGLIHLPPAIERERLLEDREAVLKQEGHYATHYHFLGGKWQFDYIRHIIDLLDLPGCERIEHRAYLSVIEAIYFDNSAHKPPFVGAPDSYRDRVYSINREDWSWSVRDLDNQCVNL